jgi:uncharacterized membrane protein YdbT with pleckstrin-like domain
MSIPLNANENILKIVRKPFVVYFLPILASLILVLGACFFLVPLFNLGWWGKIIFWFLIILGALFALRVAFNALGNKIIITNQGVILIFQRGFFSRKIFKIGYDQIRDVALSIKGFFPTVLRLGTLEFNLTNSQEVLRFSHLAAAHQIQELILKQRALPRKTDLDQLDNYELAAMAREIRERLGRDVFKKIAEE